MALYSCFRCSKTFEDTRAEHFACPHCHAKVYPHTGGRPLKVSDKRLLVIHQHKLYAERPKPNPVLRRRNSLSNTLDAYQQKQGNTSGQREGIGGRLAELRERYPVGKGESLHDTSSMDVYPLILAELAQVLGTDTFILYGSGSLWLEGNPRPQKQVRIKDLDMAVRCPEGTREKLAQTIKDVVGKTCAAHSINMEDTSHVYLTKGNTLEFISPNETLQFSFNLQSPEEYAKTLQRAKRIEIFKGVTVQVAGLDFITHRLFGDDALIATRLFRADKTRQVLMYAAMAVGYGRVTLEEIVRELLDRTLRLEPDKLVQQLRAVGKDAYNNCPTEFHERTLTIVTAYEKEKEAAQKLADPVQRQLKKEKDQLLKVMNKHLQLHLPKTEVRTAQKEFNPILMERWRDSTAPRKTQAEGEAAARLLKAVQQLKKDTLDFLLECLDDVDTQLLLADWLSFEQLVKIKRGKQLLAEALLGGPKPKPQSQPKPQPSTNPTQAFSMIQIQQSPGNNPQQVRDRLQPSDRVRVEYHRYYDVVGTVSRIIDDRVYVSVTNCYRPGTTTEIRTEHTGIVLNKEVAWYMQDVQKEG